MMITASGAEQERIEGYRKGADDYLPKPFNFTEMMLRIDALLRRSKTLNDSGMQKSSNTILVKLGLSKINTPSMDLLPGAGPNTLNIA